MSRESARASCLSACPSGIFFAHNSCLCSCAELLSLVLTPITGAVVGRYYRKAVIIFADSIAALASAPQALDFISGNLTMSKDSIMLSMAYLYLYNNTNQ